MNEWRKEYKVDMHDYSSWLMHSFPGKHWKEINTEENRKRYIEERNSSRWKNRLKPLTAEQLQKYKSP